MSANCVRRVAFGVYVHIPFCIRKCVYCDFNSYPVSSRAGRSLVARYIRALSAEIPRARDRVCSSRSASSLYIGGGTPTVVPAGDLAGIVRACSSLFGLDDGAEITVECNPGTVDYQDLRILRAAGVNRLSVGVQALDDGLLRSLGRIHTAKDALATVGHARRAGFANINLDLMFGIPGQTLRLWEDTLGKAMALGSEHMSTYPLELEEGAPLHRSVSAGEVGLPPEDEALDMWDAAMEMLKASGYARYEISNYSKPGYECRHNLTYWKNGEYLGVGAGACSHISRRRYRNVVRPLEFCEAVEKGRNPVTEIIPPASASHDVALVTEMCETAMMGLRLSGGLSLRDFRDRFGRDLAEVFPGVVEYLSGLGLVSESAGSVRLTRRGLFVANAVFREFVPQAVP